MRKNKYILFPLLLILLTAGSCKRELLKPLPQTSVADVSVFSSPARIQEQVLSMYGALKNGNFYGGRYVIDGDIKADNFINELSNLVTSADVWGENPTNSATAIVGLWQYAYLTINTCNLFIDGMDSIGSGVVGQPLATNYIAEAKLIRALSYYTLLQYYSYPYTKDGGASKGLPLRLSGIKSAGQSALARSSVADVYTQIIKDLNDAEAGLPNKYSSAYNNTTRAHTNTAIALKTRVFLSMGRYDSAIAAANRIVSANAPFTSTSGVSSALQSDITKVFVSPYTTSESIFSLPMTATTGDNPATQNQLAYYWEPGSKLGGVGNGEYSLNAATGVIADSGWKSATDKRRSFILTTTTTSSSGVVTTKRWLTKFAAPSPYTDYVPVIRYSEVLLSLAEAITRSTNSINPRAVALLSAVRNRSDPSTAYTVANFATPDALNAAILQERNIEFLGEGLRNNDLMRLLLTIPKKGAAPAKGLNDVGYIWPISATELSLNPLCTDN
jgi:hypothetical protein